MAPRLPRPRERPRPRDLPETLKAELFVFDNQWSMVTNHSLSFILIAWCEVRVKGIIIQGVQESVTTLVCHGFIETQLRKEHGATKRRLNKGD